MVEKCWQPCLEYDVEAWNPFLRGDIKRIEKVQERATKTPYDFSELEFKERPRRLHLTSIEDRRTRGYYRDV